MYELYPCLEQVQHSFTEYKSYMYMFKSLSQFNYWRMPLVEQELPILPEKMSSPKVLMGFILLDLQLPVSWGSKSPLSYRSTSWTDISRASGILKGPVVQKNFLSQPLKYTVYLFLIYLSEQDLIYNVLVGEQFSPFFIQYF